MKQRVPLLFTMSVSVCVHAALFFLVSIKASGPPRLPAEDRAAEGFSLINIALLEPAAPPPPREKPPIPRPSPALPPSDPVPAENYTVREAGEARDENGDESGDDSNTEQAAAAERTASDEGAVLPAALPSERRTDNSARTAEYVKRSLTYIQRLIRSKLVYPPQARRAGVQGLTEVSFTIHEDGGVSDVTVRTSSGHGVLDEAALAAVFAAAPFPPPPSPARLAIPISFRLR
jgi:protein TonB